MVSSTSSRKPKGDSRSTPSASARATTSSPRSPTTSREMTSSDEPKSGGVCFFLLLRFGAVDFAPACRVGPGDAKRGRLSNGWRVTCGGDAGLIFDIDVSMIRLKMILRINRGKKVKGKGDDYTSRGTYPHGGRFMVPIPLDFKGWIKAVIDKLSALDLGLPWPS